MRYTKETVDCASDKRNSTDWFEETITSQVEILDSYFDFRNASLVLDKEKLLFRKTISLLVFCNIGPLRFQCDDFPRKHNLSSASCVKKILIATSLQKSWFWEEKTQESWFQRGKNWQSGDTVSLLVFCSTSSLNFPSE